MTNLKRVKAEIQRSNATRQAAKNIVENIELALLKKHFAIEDEREKNEP